MSRRIIGQCSITDFKSLDELALKVDSSGKTPIMLPRELTKKETLALGVAAYFIDCGVSTRVLQKIKEVLIWEQDDPLFPGKKNLQYEFKLLDPKDRETALILMGMHPKEKKDPR
jgi:hypothetical protein